MVEVRYIYSACVVISTQDVKILCDPWFTERVYDGSWFQFPKLKNHLQKIGDVDAVEVLAFDPKSVVLDDGGDAAINTADFLPSRKREKLYSKEQFADFLKTISDKKMDYERLINESEIHQLPLKKNLRMAYKKALARSEVQNDYYFAIEISKGEFALFNAKIDSNFFKFCQQDDLRHYQPRSEIYIDPRYLFGLISHVYHWDNAETGSQFMTRRFPNLFDRAAQRFLNYLAV